MSLRTTARGAAPVVESPRKQRTFASLSCAIASSRAVSRHFLRTNVFSNIFYVFLIIFLSDISSLKKNWNYAMYVWWSVFENCVPEWRKRERTIEMFHPSLKQSCRRTIRKNVLFWRSLELKLISLFFDKIIFQFTSVYFSDMYHEVSVSSLISFLIHILFINMIFKISLRRKAYKRIMNKLKFIYNTLNGNFQRKFFQKMRW